MGFTQKKKSFPQAFQSVGGGFFRLFFLKGLGFFSLLRVFFGFTRCF